MNYKLLNFIILMVAMLLLSCKSKQVPLNIVNLDQAQGLRSVTSLYMLPKTAIKVIVTAERIDYSKGPYYQFAQSYLDLKDVISEDGHQWYISNVEFEAYPVADTNHVYLIETSPERDLLQFTFNKEGFLESINESEEISNQNFSTNLNLKEETVNDNHKNILLRKEVKINFDDVPLPKDVVTKNALSEQASVLANKILTLREDRAALLVGDGYTQALPVGETMKTMIENIDKIQEKYISMFSGKITRSSFNYTFNFVPDEPRKITQDILFRFSNESGVLKKDDMNGMPVIIEIESNENLKDFEQFKKRQFYLEKVAKKNEPEKGFLYRIPEMGYVKLIKDDNVLKQEKVQIAQFGSLQFLPFRYLDGNYIIRFYPDLGSIKSISLKNNTKKEKGK